MSETILCQECLVGGYETEYKGDSVIRCEECDNILYREMTQ